MELYKSKLNRPAKLMSKPLSTILTSKLLYTGSRYLELYLSFLLGKGAGGSSIYEEVKGATQNIYRESPIVFDVGTNIGDWSKQFLDIKPNAKIFQFEPSETCRKIITELNLKNTVLIPYAMGKEESEAYFFSSSAIDEVDCSASLYERKDTRWGEFTYQKQIVKVTCIDKIIAEYSLDFVDFIKLDIEGHELEALKGAANAFADKKIGAFAFEFGTSNTNSRTFFRDFWDFLKDKGFQLFRVTPGLSLVEITGYYEDLEFFRGATNYIARLVDHPYR
jgi:FkbM family methyltransferase